MNNFNNEQYANNTGNPNFYPRNNHSTGKFGQTSGPDDEAQVMPTNFGRG